MNMARKVDKTIKICVICGDRAKGINFNVLTCMSCKAFFRRNALRKKDMKCPFNDTCQIDKITRKFCSKCRLKKCFESGMKKEWILSDEEKRLIKEKIIRNKLRKQQLELERQQQLNVVETSTNNNNNNNGSSKRSIRSYGNGGRRRNGGSIKSIGQQPQTTLAMNPSKNNTESMIMAQQQTTTAANHYGCMDSLNAMKFNGYNNEDSTAYMIDNSNDVMFNHIQTPSSMTSKYCSSSPTISSSSSSSPPRGCHLFTEPSAYSLDTLLTSDESDIFLDSGTMAYSTTTTTLNNHHNNNNCVPQMNHPHNHHHSNLNIKYEDDFSLSYQSSNNSTLYNNNNNNNRSDVNNIMKCSSLSSNYLNHNNIINNNNNNNILNNNGHGDINNQNGRHLDLSLPSFVNDVIADDGLRFTSSSISSSLNDCCFLFSNSIDSIDFFDHDLENLEFNNNNNGTNVMANTNGTSNHNHADAQPNTRTTANNNEDHNDRSIMNNNHNPTTTMNYDILVNTKNDNQTKNNPCHPLTDLTSPPPPPPPPPPSSSSSSFHGFIKSEFLSNDDFVELNDNKNNIRKQVPFNALVDNVSERACSIDETTRALNDCSRIVFNTSSSSSSSSSCNGTYNPSSLLSVVDVIKHEDDNQSDNNIMRVSLTDNKNNGNTDKVNQDHVRNDDDDDDDDGDDDDDHINEDVDGDEANINDDDDNNNNNNKDFSQYLLHGNDPSLAFQQHVQMQQQNNINKVTLMHPLPIVNCSRKSSLTISNTFAQLEPYNDNVIAGGDGDVHCSENTIKCIEYGTNGLTMIHSNDSTMNSRNNSLYKNDYDDYLSNYLTGRTKHQQQQQHRNYNQQQTDMEQKSMNLKPLRNHYQLNGNHHQRANISLNPHQQMITKQINLFSSDELILSEQCLIEELSHACSILQNPYKRIMTNYSLHSHNCSVTGFYIHRLIRMSKRLHSFSNLMLDDQVQLLKRGLLEMLCLRSVLLYDPDREAFGFLDDKCKLSIMVSVDVIKPCCIKYDYRRHKSFPNKFMHEWKTDNVIFDLLTAILLFTPRPELRQNEKIKEENSRYKYLLRRYLEIKYNNSLEAKNAFTRLMSCIDEIRLLNEDISRVFVTNYRLVHNSPLFIQLLDLKQPEQSTTNNNNSDFKIDSPTISTNNN